MEPLKHLPDVLRRFNERPRQSQAFNYMKNGHWFHISTEQVIEEVESIALGLKDLGISKGDCIGIYGKSSPYWSIADFAITLCGAITVPFFSNLSEKHFLFELEQTKPKWIFIGNGEDWENIKPHKHLFEGTIGIEEGAIEHTTYKFYDLLEKGRDVKERLPGLLVKMEAEIKSDDIATIIYSSGSTGTPKGIELTHKNLVSTIHHDDFSLNSKDKYLSILPLAHIFAKQLHLTMTAWGIPIYFLNDLTEIASTCKKREITRMITVPRVLEKSFSKISENINNSNIISKLLGWWAIDLAHREHCMYKTVMTPIADSLLYCKIRNAFGEKLHSIISGGAALNPHLHQFFLSIGIPILQGWGLTEGSCMAVNVIEKNKIGTVGPPLKGITFKISPEGEVLAKGPTIMKGYYKNPQATKQAIDSEGWLHTEDYGHIDEDGHLVIKGRMKEAFKTSRGEFVTPVNIEQKLCEFPIIDMAMIIGEERPYPAALLFPDIPSLQRLKKKYHSKHLSDEEFLNSNEISKKLEKLIGRVNQPLDQWQKVKSYRFILSPPTIDGGELTPTLKLRRGVVLEKYQPIIEEMYQNKDQSQV